MFHTSSGRCLVALCFVLRWSATAAARPFSTATNLEPDEQEIKPVEQEINPSFDVDTYARCELSEGLYTMSNLSEIWCASGNSGKSLKNIIEMNPNSSNKLVLAPGKPVRLVGKGKGWWLVKFLWRTKLDFDISLLPGASLFLEALHFQGRIEVETSTDQSKMSYLAFENCTVEPPAPDAKQLALAELERKGFQDPSASAWQGWLMLRHAALTLQIHGSRLNGGAFVEQSTNFSLSASNSSFSQGFQLVNVTSHIQLAEVEVWSGGRNPSFKMLSGRPEVHVAGSTFYGSAIEIIDSLDLILDVGGNTRITGGPGQHAIVVNGYEGHRSQVDLQDVEITRSDIGVGASDFQRCISGDHFFSQCQTDVRTQVWINGLDINVRINNTNVSMASNIAITIYSVGNASDVKLDNIQIEQAILGADLSAKHLMAKNMYISDTQIGIRLDSDGEFELEGVKIKDVRTGLTARSAFRAKDLEISEAKVTAIDFKIKTDLPSQATGVSISDCSVAVKCDHCDSLSMDDVLIAGNVRALESHDDTDFQMSSGLVFFNSWNDTLAINQGKRANVLVWSRLPCPIAIASSYLACGLATILFRIGLEQHFSGGFETTTSGQMWKYVPAAASLLLWIMVLEAVVAALLLLTMSWKYEHQRQVHLEIVKFYATIWLTGLLALLTAAIIYLYITVIRRRSDIKTLADLKRTEMLLQQKDGLKASLDNVELREEMDRIQMQMFLAKTTGDQAKVQETFDVMKSKAEEEASRLADWYAERRTCYASEDAGARLKALEGIPSQTLAEAVQLPLPTTDESESLDMLCATASWLRSNFKDHLMKVCSDLNGINSRADLQNLGFDEMQFDPATHPLQPEANASIGKHVGLLVAPVKSKDRAQAKVMTDYMEDQAAGKKSELPLARYVCDFLRATIFASDPYVLAVAFWQLQKEFEFVRVKNKFGEEGLRPELRTNILVNLWVKHGDCALIGEVQFLLQDYLTAKSLQHLYYDVARAASPEELWGKPIFR